SCVVRWFLRFFFFQAEDGIRDWSVTGVQTCALPIYFGVRSPAGAGGRSNTEICEGAFPPSNLWPGASPGFCSGAACRSASNENRSEERRVGEEGRGRGAGGY